MAARSVCSFISSVSLSSLSLSLHIVPPCGGTLCAPRVCGIRPARVSRAHNAAYSRAQGERTGWLPGASWVRLGFSLHTRAHAPAHAHTHTHTFNFMHKGTYTDSLTHTRDRDRVCMNAVMFMHTHTHTHTHARTHARVHARIYTRTHAHTHCVLFSNEDQVLLLMTIQQQLNSIL